MPTPPPSSTRSTSARSVRDVATTLGVILTHAPLLGVPAWKVGADLAGLHRPDKIVLYLASAERADRVAAALALTLGDTAAQGVPFTGQVGATGIVSRGRDVAGTSWRADVCRVVAESLCATRVTLGLQAALPTSPTRRSRVLVSPWARCGDVAPCRGCAARIALCGNLFRRHTSRRRQDRATALRVIADRGRSRSPLQPCDTPEPR